MNSTKTNKSQVSNNNVVTTNKASELLASISFIDIDKKLVSRKTFSDGANDSLYMAKTLDNYIVINGLQLGVMDIRALAPDEAEKEIFKLLRKFVLLALLLESQLDDYNTNMAYAYGDTVAKKKGVLQEFKGAAIGVRDGKNQSVFILNPDKAEVVVLGKRYDLSALAKNSISLYPTTSVIRNSLGYSNKARKKLAIDLVQAFFSSLDITSKVKESFNETLKDTTIML